MANQLSGVAIIICIAVGFTTFILLFLFGKRQIMRFALKSRRGPHFPIASDAPRQLRKEIERRLDVVKDIKHDPLLITPKDEVDLCLSGDQILPHVYRMKAVDSLKLLEKDILNVCNGDQSKLRQPRQDLQFYLKKLARDSGPLSEVSKETLAAFIESYSHARHDPLPFGEPEYKRHLDILEQVRHELKSNPVPPTKSSPTKGITQRTSTLETKV